MNSYRDKTFGRNDEVATVYKHFEADRDLSMHGPRRIGKSFLLDRIVDEGEGKGWVAIKVEITGCADTRTVFRELCGGISKRLSKSKILGWVTQRITQFAEPRNETGGTWYQPFTELDHESYFERLIKTLHDDPKQRWGLLIDELPIFLKTLHDKGNDGIATARNFMNQISQLRQKYPRVRWMITGSIGIEPLAKLGNYMGVLAKFTNFELQPLSAPQAKDFVQYLATNGQLMHRQEITAHEADALVRAVGWLAPYYLEALAHKVKGSLCTAPETAKKTIEQAIQDLLKQTDTATFGTWEEHLRKHYTGAPLAIAFAVLAALAQNNQGMGIDGLLTQCNDNKLTKENLRQIIMHLDADGFVSVDSWDNESPHFIFRNPLLRRWWNKFRPQATL